MGQIQIRTIVHVRPSKPSKSDRSFGPLSRVRRSHPGQDVLRPVSDAVRRQHQPAGYVIAGRVEQVNLGGGANTDFPQSIRKIRYIYLYEGDLFQPEILTEILRDLSNEQPLNTLDIQIGRKVIRFFKSIDLAGSPSNNPLISSTPQRQSEPQQCEYATS